MMSRTAIALGLCVIAVAVTLGLVLVTGPDRTNGPVVSTYAGDGKRKVGEDGGDRRATSMESPSGLAWNRDGNLLYLEAGRETGSRLRRIHLETGVVETIAGGGALDPDNIPAREARLPPFSAGLAVDSDGDIYIGAPEPGTLLRIDARSGLVTRIIGNGNSRSDQEPADPVQLLRPVAIRVDRSNVVYIVDFDLHVVFAFEADTGVIRTVAGVPGEAGYSGDGGPASNARLNSPTDVALAPDGDLFIADNYNHAIRHVEADTGVISTFAGKPGVAGFAGDGLDRRRAQFSYPVKLLLQEDVLLVADRLNHRVRSINLTSGLVETVAGTGEISYSGENIPARAAGIYEPEMMVSYPDGGFLVAGSRARRIFLVGDPVAVPVPWWRSGWAIASYVTVLVFLAVLIVRRQTRVLRARTAELKATVAARSQELGAQRAVIERQAEELRSLIAQKDQLIARVSHEFRTPLTVILGPIDRLSRRATVEPLRQYLDVTGRNSRRLLRLVDDLLELGRLKSDVAVDTVSVAVTPIVRRIVSSAESHLHHRGIQVELRLLEDCAWQTTKEAFETITSRALSLAVEMLPRGGLVRISQKTDGEKGHLIVAVHGVGDGKYRRDQPSESSSADSADNLPEPEIGWMLVQQLAAAHGGVAHRADGPNSTAMIRVTLPVAKAPPAPAVDTGLVTNHEALFVAERETGSVESISPQAHSTTILVIEDNVDMREYLRELLSSHYRCLLAEDGYRGMELAQEELPDLIICDVLLPGLNGYSVCRELKNDDVTCHIPVILLTALRDSETKIRSLRERPDDYITKPFREAELLARVANLIEIRTMLRRRYGRELRLHSPLPDDMEQADKSFLRRLESVCEEHHTSPDLNVAKIASLVALSERQLQRKVRALLDLSPAEYLRNFRLQAAHEQLAAGRRPSDVAIAVGFGSHSHFSSCFKTKYGYAPNQARTDGPASLES